MKKQSKILNPQIVATVAVITALIGYVYWPSLMWMIERWSARDSYYAHGFLIPLVTLFWIYQKRAVISETLIQPNYLGLVVILAAAAMQVVSHYLRFYFLSAFSMVFMIGGAVLFMGGARFFRKIWFPIMFLFLMIPLPLLVIAQVTLKLKFFVSAAATMAINAMGIHAVQQGSYIYTNHSILIVGDPCSGLRSFLAFLTLGFVFAYDEKLNFTKRSLIVFTGLPLAIISNICRVIFLTLVGEIYGMQYTGPGALPHDISGIAVFVIAFLVFMVLKQKLETKHEALS